MVNYPTISLSAIIGEVVESVKDERLAELQAYDSIIETINYIHGNWQEVTQRMQEMAANGTERPKQFPVFILIEDVVIDRRNAPLYGIAENVNIIIANWTKDSYKSAQREAINFGPILRPLYYSFCKYLAKHPGVSIYSEREVSHRYAERKYWGMDGNTVNALGYYIDAIDITNLTIPLDWSYCNNIINANII